MTNEVREIAEAIGKHDAEWILAFRQLMETIKRCTPEQIEQAIRMFKAMKGGD